MSTKPLHFETTLKEIETIIEKMADGKLNLEEALASFEKGITLARQCQTQLKTAEQKVQILMDQNDAKTPFKTDDFEPED